MCIIQKCLQSILQYLAVSRRPRVVRALALHSSNQLLHRDSRSVLIATVVMNFSSKAAAIGMNREVVSPLRRSPARVGIMRECVDHDAAVRSPSLAIQQFVHPVQLFVCPMLAVFGNAIVVRNDVVNPVEKLIHSSVFLIEHLARLIRALVRSCRVQESLSSGVRHLLVRDTGEEVSGAHRLTVKSWRPDACVDVGSISHLRSRPVAALMNAIPVHCRRGIDDQASSRRRWSS